MQEDTAGDPRNDKKWSRKDTRSISREMSARGVRLCPNTAAKLLKHCKYSLRVNRKSSPRRSIQTATDNSN
jgi:Rhodopirellula transposase DDE domain